MNDVFALWTIFSIFVGVSLAIDLGVFSKLRKKDSHKEVPPFKAALRWTIVWISLAGIFAGIIYVDMGQQKLTEFVTGYALEKSLSVDNMFVFLLIFTSLNIPHKFQHRVLSMGILGAIAMRVPLIMGGAHLLEEFDWMIYLFGAFLIFTALRMLIQREEKKIEVEKNIAVRALKKIMPVELNIQDPKFFLIKDGIKYATPLLVALVIIEFTDLLFALDSIPAVLAITTDPFIVITSNVFAILGLRSLYFLLAGVMEKFHYLKPGLIAILMFIGVKMMISKIVDIPTVVSLGVVMGILGIAILASFLHAKKHPE
ncbi:MAG: TerC family protein [Nitrososphaeria archaeon]|nr:TerC family protein [Nitrososphaeria archaeon]NDB50838.1 TerC family protein [Nitrosopumilaceae archaeon]NDB89541.1 TerC family protein [Nitrososphaerota archaeon]NDB46007.1 TerC family protein [Nitrososphaeria archaeon]NDB91205.1 TerC family protein [Nitrososphaeria archaeon]